MSNLFNKAVLNLIQPTQKRAAADPSAWPFYNFPGAFSTTKQGQKINPATALKISAFWCGVNTIANSVALLPKTVYQVTGNDRARAAAHPVDYLIHKEPSILMSAFSFWFIMALSVIMRGNGYARIVRNNAGRVIRLEYLDPWKVQVINYQGELFYKIDEETLTSYQVIHVPGFSYNGYTGRSVLEYAADSMGVSLGAMEYGAGAYNDRGITYGVLESDQEINEIGRKNINAIFNQAMNSSDRYKVAIFDEGLKYKSISLSPSESLFIEAQAAGVEDIARWLSIPLHKLHTKGEGGYNFLVQMSIEYLQTAVMPMGQKIKEELERKLFTDRERAAGYYIQLNYKKLLEADPASRAQFYKDMVYIKAMNPNEVRALEDLNPYDGGEQFLQQANMQTQAQINNTLQNG